jgi:hypothetical protein
LHNTGRQAERFGIHLRKTIKNNSSKTKKAVKGFGEAPISKSEKNAT